MRIDLKTLAQREHVVFVHRKCPILSCPHVCSALIGKHTHTQFRQSLKPNRHQQQHQKKSSPTTQNTHSHLTRPTTSMMHTLDYSPPARRYAQTFVTNTQKNRRAVTEFVDGPSRVEKIVMTDGPAPRRQCFGNHDDLVSVPVPDVSFASENTTQS